MSEVFLEGPEAKTPPLMTSEQLVSVLQCTNTGIKALLHVLPEIGANYHGTDLDALLLESQGHANQQVWHVSRNISRNNIEGQGLIDEGSYVKHSEPGNTTYRLSEAGEQIVRPVAAHLLVFSRKYGVGLNELIGQTVGRKQSDGVCENRLTVVASIVQMSRSEEAFLASSLNPITGINTRTLHNHLRDMKGFGLLESVTEAGRHNKVRLTELGEVVFSEYIEMLTKTATFDPDFYLEGQRLAHEIASDSSQVREIIEIIQSRSNMASRQSVAITGRQIMSMLRSEGILPTGAIAEALGYKPTQISRILGKLVASDQVRSTKLGREKYWEIASS